MSPMNNRRMVPTQEPGILDFAPGAAAAYSLRNLSLSYAGPVVTVRRSTDSAEAEFTAAEVSDGTLAAWCSGGDGFVTTWHDQSQHGMGLTQATAGYQPKIVDAGTLITEGEKAAVRFDGSDDFLRVPASASAFSFLHSSAASVFVAIRIGAAANPDALYEVLSTGAISSSLVGYDLFYDDRSSSGKSDALRVLATNGATSVFNVEAKDSVTPNTQTLLSVITDASSPIADRASLFVLGVDLNVVNASTGTPAATASQYDLSLGVSGAGVYKFLGTISELIIYPTDQTAIRTRIEGNINRQFGVF